MLKIINKSYSDGNLKLELKFLKSTDLDLYLGKSIKYYLKYGTFVKKNKGIDNYKLIKGGNLIIKKGEIQIDLHIGDLKGEYIGKDIDIGYQLLITTSLVKFDSIDLYNAMIPIGYTHVYSLTNIDLYNSIPDDISYGKVWTDMPTGLRMLFIGLVLWLIPLLLDFGNSGIFGLIMLVFAYLIYYLYSSGGYDISLNTKKIRDNNVYLNDLIKFKSTKVITGARFEISLLNKEAYLFSSKDSNGREIEETAIKIINRKRIVNIKMDKISKTEDFYGYLNRTQFDLETNLKEVIPNLYYNQYTLSGSILDIEIKFISDEYRDFTYEYNLNSINHDFYSKYILKDKFTNIVKNIKDNKETEQKLIIENKPLNFIQDSINKEEKYINLDVSNSIDVSENYNNILKFEKKDINEKEEVLIENKDKYKEILELDNIKEVTNNSLNKSINIDLGKTTNSNLEFNNTFGSSNSSFGLTKTFTLNKEKIDTKENEEVEKKEINNEAMNNTFGNNSGMFKKSTLFDK